MKKPKPQDSIDRDEADALRADREAAIARDVERDGITFKIARLNAELREARRTGDAEEAKRLRARISALVAERKGM